MFMRHKKWAAMYAGMRVAVLAASVKMRIVNDAGPCFACSDADQLGRSEGDTVDASDDDDAD